MILFVGIVGTFILILTWFAIVNVIVEMPVQRAEYERKYYKYKIDTLERELNALEDKGREAEEITSAAYKLSEDNYADRAELESAEFALAEESEGMDETFTSTTPEHRPLCHDKPIVIDTRFFHSFQLGEYADALGGAIARRALEEDIRVDIRRVDVRSVPYALYATVSSFKYSGVNEYKTSLISCTCPYNSKNDKVCKHMMALAIKSGAVSVDVSPLLNF